MMTSKATYKAATADAQAETKKLIRDLFQKLENNIRSLHDKKEALSLGDLNEQIHELTVGARSEEAAMHDRLDEIFYDLRARVGCNDALTRGGEEEEEDSGGVRDGDWTLASDPGPYVDGSLYVHARRHEPSSPASAVAKAWHPVHDKFIRPLAPSLRGSMASLYASSKTALGVTSTTLPKILASNTTKPDDDDDDDQQQQPEETCPSEDGELLETTCYHPRTTEEDHQGGSREVDDPTNGQGPLQTFTPQRLQPAPTSHSNRNRDTNTQEQQGPNALEEVPLPDDVRAWLQSLAPPEPPHRCRACGSAATSLQ